MIHTPRVLDIKEKTVLVRVDFNVPLKKIVRNGNTKYVVSDDQRIRSALETILFLREHGAKIILMSHLGRPDGQVVKKFSLEPVAFYLKHNLGLDVQFATDCIGEKVTEKTVKLKSGDILLLENLRFHEEEETNNTAFAKKSLKTLKQKFLLTKLSLLLTELTLLL